jgi:hypothetical protein
MAASNRKKPRSAYTPDGRETQIVSDAYDLAERQIRDGTASAQVITHFLKLGSSRERLEQSRLENENLLLAAKIEQMAAQRQVADLYVEALSAMRTYSGNGEVIIDTDLGEGFVD